MSIISILSDQNYLFLEPYEVHVSDFAEWFILTYTNSKQS